MANEIKKTRNKGEYIEVCGNDLQGINEMIITALKNTGGRPACFPETQQGLEDFRQQVLAFFEHVAAVNEQNGLEKGVIPDIELMCSYLGLTRQTLFRYQTQRNNEWKETIESVKNAIASYKKQMGLTYRIPPMILAFDFANNHDYKNTSEFHLTAETVVTKEQQEHQKLEAEIKEAGLTWNETTGEFEEV